MKASGPCKIQVHIIIKMPQKCTIQLKLFAGLQKYMPPDSENHPIEAGTTVGEVLAHLEIPKYQIKLIFIDGVKAKLTTILKGGERIGIFPPVGGG